VEGEIKGTQLVPTGMQTVCTNKTTQSPQFLLYTEIMKRMFKP